MAEPEAPSHSPKIEALPHVRDWPHSPVHRLSDAGAYIVTSGTYNKLPLFGSAYRLSFLTETLLGLAEIYGWRLQAWSIFSNHYHFVAESNEAVSLKKFISHLHTVTAKSVNLLDDFPARKVWFQYWETQITFPRSFFARLNYVHQNAVHHKLARKASDYPWCSAGWFERKANSAFYKTVTQFPCDKVAVPDEFEVGGTEISGDRSSRTGDMGG